MQVRIFKGRVTEDHKYSIHFLTANLCGYTTEAIIATPCGLDGIVRQTTTLYNSTTPVRLKTYLHLIVLKGEWRDKKILKYFIKHPVEVSLNHFKQL